MRNGYIICGLAPDAAHIVLAADGLPPASIATTDWSQFPMIKEPELLIDGTYFLLRIPGNAAGLYLRSSKLWTSPASIARAMTGWKITGCFYEPSVRSVAAQRTDVLLDLTLSPERIRQRELEMFQWEEAGDWLGILAA